MTKIFIYNSRKTKKKQSPIKINRRKAISKIYNINYMVYGTKLNPNSTAA